MAHNSKSDFNYKLPIKVIEQMLDNGLKQELKRIPELQKQIIELKNANMSMGHENTYLKSKLTAKIEETERLKRLVSDLQKQIQTKSHEKVPTQRSVQEFANQSLSIEFEESKVKVEEIIEIDTEQVESTDEIMEIQTTNPSNEIDSPKITENSV